MEALAQEISNELVDLAHWVRLDPTDAQQYVSMAASITARLEKLAAMATDESYSSLGVSTGSAGNA